MCGDSDSSELTRVLDVGTRSVRRAARSMPRQVCLLLACALACVAGHAYELDNAAEGFGSILLVVGDVTASSARVVFDSLEKTLQGSRVSVTIFEHETDKIVENGQDIVYDDSVTLAAYPKVWSIRGLPADTAFRVEFVVEGDERPPSKAFFYTFSASKSFPFRFFSISCNRMCAAITDPILYAETSSYRSRRRP